jgi:hypothetical protein
MQTRYFTKISTSALLLFSLLTAQAQDQSQQNPIIKPICELPAAPVQMQVVFALDVTGSMGSLINAARDKIWSIANSLRQSNTQIDLEIGVVAYRDRGDQFVTKIIGLNTDIDQVFSELNALSASGGGDTPESVNQALKDAVNAIHWDQSPSTIRTIFLVGDCPPHMNYRKDVPYQETCQLALSKDIVINTIQMGSNGSTRVIWQEIASLTRGEFNNTDMNVNQVAISTPFDEELKRKTMELEESKTYYGNQKIVEEQVQIKEIKIQAASTMTVETAARRADYYSTSGYDTDFYGSNEIITDIAAGDVSLDDIEEADLPEHLQVIPVAERKEYLDTLVANRLEVQDEIESLIKQREVYITNNNSAAVLENSLSNKVLQSVKRQAASKDIKIDGKAKF